LRIPPSPPPGKLGWRQPSPERRRPMRFFTDRHQNYCCVDLHTRSMYLCILNDYGKVWHSYTLHIFQPVNRYISFGGDLDAEYFHFLKIFFLGGDKSGASGYDIFVSSKKALHFLGI
jgi:hypothetical protein